MKGYSLNFIPTHLILWYIEQSWWFYACEFSFHLLNVIQTDIKENYLCCEHSRNYNFKVAWELFLLLYILGYNCIVVRSALLVFIEYFRIHTKKKFWWIHLQFSRCYIHVQQRHFIFNSIVNQSFGCEQLPFCWVLKSFCWIYQTYFQMCL